MTLVCPPVHLHVNKHPLEYLYNCVRESKESERKREREEDR